MKNHFKFEGNLSNSFPIRSTPNGTSVLNFSVKTSVETGSGKTITPIHPCTAWGELAEEISRYQKGDPITVEGYAATRTERAIKDGREFNVLVTDFIVTEVEGGVELPEEIIPEPDDDLPF